MKIEQAITDFKKLRIFGCKAYVYIPDVKSKKFEPKAEKLIFVEHFEHHKGYCFLNRNADKIIFSRDARFVVLDNGSEVHADTGKLSEPEQLVEVYVTELRM